VPNALLPPLLEQNFADIRAPPPFPQLHRPGTVHTILTRPEFYSVQLNGVRLRDWVANLRQVVRWRMSHPQCQVAASRRTHTNATR